MPSRPFPKVCRHPLNETTCFEANHITHQRHKPHHLVTCVISLPLSIISVENKSCIIKSFMDRNHLRCVVWFWAKERLQERKMHLTFTLEISPLCGHDRFRDSRQHRLHLLNHTVVIGVTEKEMESHHSSVNNIYIWILYIVYLKI